MDWREMLIFAPLVIATLWLGFQPGLVFNITASSVDGLLGASIVQSNALAPPAAPAPLATAEPRGLKIALVVGIVLLVIVVAAVAVLYFRMKGLR